MKKFLRKRWHRIPVGIISALLVLGLLAGGAFAAYTFLSFTTVITVDEPLTMEASWYDYNADTWTDWWTLTGGSSSDELDLYMSPGETQTLALRIYNESYGALTVNTAITGAVGRFTFNGFPDGSIPGSDGDPTTYEWTSVVTIACDSDAPSGTYNVTFTFQRS